MRVHFSIRNQASTSWGLENEDPNDILIAERERKVDEMVRRRSFFTALLFQLENRENLKLGVKVDGELLRHFEKLGEGGLPKYYQRKTTVSPTPFSMLNLTTPSPAANENEHHFIKTLIIASESGDAEAVYTLLELAPHLIQSPTVSYCFMRAVFTGKTEVVSLFLELGFDPNLLYPFGLPKADVDKRSSATQFALFAGHLDIVKIFVAYDPQLPNKKFGPMQENIWFFAARSRNCELMKYSLSFVPLELQTPTLTRACDNYTLLRIAILSGDLKMVQYLRSQGQEDLPQGSIDGQSSYHAAVTSENHELLQWLIENRYEQNFLEQLNKQDSDGDTPLYFAAARGNYRMFEILLRAGADIAIPNYRGSVVIHAAAKAGNLQIIRKCIELGLGEQTTDQNELTTLHYAAGAKDATIFFSLQLHSREDRQGNTPLHHAALLGNLSIVRALLVPNYPCDLKLLQNAVHSENYELVAYILNRNNFNLGELASNEKHPLYIAASHRNFGIIKILVENGAIIVPFMLEDIIVAAINSNDPANLEIAINWGCSPTDPIAEYERPPIHFATEQGNLDMVILLYENGADLDGKDSAGNSLLHKAACTKNRQLINWLLSKGLSSSEQNNDNKTPLHFAIGEELYGEVELLATKDNINSKDNQGRTVIDYMILNKQEPCNFTWSYLTTFSKLALLSGKDRDYPEDIIHAFTKREINGALDSNKILRDMQNSDEPSQTSLAALVVHVVYQHGQMLHNRQLAST